ncbi:MAG: hypothetical protein ACK5D5_04380 [Bacteroidota bacterium]
MVLPKAGVALARFYHFSILDTLIASGGSCLFSSILFTLLFDGAVKWWENYLNKKFPNRNKNKKKFTKKNRLIIKIKKRFGTPGICCIGPLFLSIPLSSFLSIRYFGSKGQTLFWLCFFSIFWVITFYYFADAIVNLFG